MNLHKIFVIILATTWINLVLGKLASEIPRAGSKTSSSATTCGLAAMPAPVLADCTEAIPAGIPDHRGTWGDDKSYQRIEQCGLRYVVSGPGSTGFYIHDFPAADGTTANGVTDYNATKFPDCSPVSAVGVFKDNCMNMVTGTITGATRCLKTDGTLDFYNLQLGTTNLKKDYKPASTPAGTTNSLFLQLSMFLVMTFMIIL